MKILIGHVGEDHAGYHNIRIDQRSILGNPHATSKMNKTQRDLACDRYDVIFDIKVHKDGPFRNEILKLIELARTGNNINLQCWCEPKRCHGETIKRYIENNM